MMLSLLNSLENIAMVDDQIQAYSSSRGFHKKTVDRWLLLPEADQKPLLELAETLKLGENHFRDFFDWLKEIALRDGSSLGQVLKREAFTRVLSDPRLGRSDKLKCLKEEVRRLRFPRLSRIEEEIEEKIGNLKLKGQIQMNVPPGLEGGALTIQIRATSFDELRRLVMELGHTLEGDSVREIFALLSGEGTDAGL
jgi:hypothetical protein